ncbi:hypothetical protein QWT69_02695 [Sporosarcina oncorhynchi]|uniref:Uncharacterized protein n=1 Tax=Sporosarcina oncorhynchi TaxID=3056444 RepID=A0ABZ0L7Y1_9BACL|nr:hypothetical protein [Sporosarcina sp. T2O-4]WOV88048.1 hypothetical protein QWT69_02695 [Sporosarcina sp. T2O-4]
MYDNILQKAKEFNLSKVSYEQLEKVMAVARHAKLPFRKSNDLEIKDSFDLALTLTGATALYESFQANGEEGRIAYLNEKGQLVHHYADGSIQIIQERA